MFLASQAPRRTHQVVTPEVIALEPGEATPGDDWWTTYAAAAASDLTKTAWSVIEADSKFIVDRGLFGTGVCR